MIPKLNSKQDNAFRFLKEDEWISPSQYASSHRKNKILEELTMMGLAVKRVNTHTADEYRKATPKEIIEHYQTAMTTA